MSRLSEDAIRILASQTAPSYGPSTPVPATALGRVADEHPVGWLPPVGGLSVSALELLLHASHPLLGTVVLGCASAASLGIAGTSARYTGGPEVFGGLLLSIAAGLGAAGCAVGGSMVAPTTVFGALGGFIALTPEWLRQSREKKQHYRAIETRRMTEQYAWAGRQQALEGKALEIEAVVYGARNTDYELRRIEDEVRALTSRLDGIPLATGTSRTELPAAGKAEPDDLMALASGLYADRVEADR